MKVLLIRIRRGIRIVESHSSDDELVNMGFKVC